MIGVDCEYIAENALQGELPGIRPDVKSIYCELMQLGACRLDSNGKERELLNLTVAPHRMHKIPVWLSTMTGMTEEKRSQGVAFPEALERLVAILDDDAWTFDGDWWVLDANAREHGMTLPLNHFRRLKPLLPEYGIALENFQAAGSSEVCSGGLYKVLGLKLPEIEGVGVHDAAHDARSLIHSVYHLRHRPA